MDSRGIISPKQLANTPSLLAGTVAIVRNSSRSSWAIQNQVTAILYVLLVSGAFTSVFHFSLKGGNVNDDGNGATLSQAEGVVFTGTVTVAGSPIRYTVLETS